jgi:trigger factor
MNVIKQKVSKEEIINNSLEKQLNKTIKDFINEKSDDKIMDNIIPESPKIDFKKVDENNLIFIATFDKIPEVSLTDYKTFDIKVMSTKVDEDEVKHEFSRMIKKDIMLTPKENGLVENGDNVNINYVGLNGKKAFSGGSAKNYDLIIGSHSFIPGFEEQLIDMKESEEKTIDVTFPKDYHAADLAGKLVKFDVTINSIATVEKPEFNKEYFSKFKIDGIENEKQFMDYLKKQLTEWKFYKSQQDFQKAFSEKIIETTKLSHFPDSLIKNEEKRIDYETNKMAEKEGKNKDEYISTLGYTDHELYQQGLRKTAERNITLISAIEKIGEELDIRVERDDIDKHFEKMAKLYNTNIKEVEEKYKENIQGLEAFIFQKKIFDKLFEIYNK